MDWIKFFFADNIIIALKELYDKGESEKLEIFKSTDYDEQAIFHFQQDLDRKLAMTIFDLRFKTNYLSNDGILNYLQIEKNKPFKPYWEDEIFDPIYYQQMTVELEVHYRQFLKQLEASLSIPEQDEKHENIKPAPLTFENLADSFKDVSDWINIKFQLIEKGYLSESGKWKDFANGYKTTAAGFIKWLAGNGYCQKAKFTDFEIQSFCLNDFGIDEISISTIGHSRPELPIKLFCLPKA